MENPEEILHSLEEFAKLKPKDIPRELEEYLCFVAKTGDPVYQWSAVKGLFREKLISVITEFYESCPSVEIPPCPNVEMFNYDSMKNFILEKLDTFAAAPFTVQRICELLTSPRKEYNRIDKYMRALEKNILVVSTTEPGNRRSGENGEGIMNGLESEHVTEGNSNNDINVEEMDEIPVWPPRMNQSETITFQNSENITIETQTSPPRETPQDAFVPESRPNEEASTSSVESVITCRPTDQPYVSIEPVASESCTCPDDTVENVSVTITAIPAPVQKRRDSIEPAITTDETTCDSEVNRKEETKENVKDSTDIEKINSEKSHITDENSTSTTKITATLKDEDDVSQEAHSTNTKASDETELSRERFNESKTTSDDSSDDKQDTLESDVTGTDQVSDLLTENSNSETSLNVTQNKQNTDCENPQETVYAVNVNIDKTASADVFNNSKATDIQKTDAESSNISLTSESSLNNESNENCNEQKVDSSTLNISDNSPESQLPENVLDNPEELVTSTEDDGNKLNEETPMEIDLDEEITTSTATSAQKHDSDTN